MWIFKIYRIWVEFTCCGIAFLVLFDRQNMVGLWDKLWSWHPPQRLIMLLDLPYLFSPIQDTLRIFAGDFPSLLETQKSDEQTHSFKPLTCHMPWAENLIKTHFSSGSTRRILQLFYQVFVLLDLVKGNAPGVWDLICLAYPYWRWLL